MLVGTTLSVDCYLLASNVEQHRATEHEGRRNPTMAAPPTYPARGPDRPHLKHARSCDPSCLASPTMVALTHVVPIMEGAPPPRVTVEIPHKLPG